MLQQDVGQGDPHVLVHGLGASHAVWQQAAALLQSDRRVLTVDVPGFGAAPPLGDGFDLWEVANALWHELPDAPLTLVGHSMGGAITAAMAAQRPQRTQRLVLCAPAGLRQLPARALPWVGRLGEAAMLGRERAAPLARTAVGRRLLLGASVAAASDLSEAQVASIVASSASASRFGAALRAVAAADLTPQLALAPARLGLLWGDGDRVVRPTLAAEALAVRPDALLATVPRTGHLPMVERPQAFAAVLRQLVRDLDRVHHSATTAADESATVQADERRGV